MNKKIIWIIAVIIIFIISASVYFVLSQQRLLSPQIVTNFEECERAGYPVGESYPRQCWTPDGRHFVEEVFNPPLKIGVYEIESSEGAEMLRHRENRFAKNEQEIMDALSTTLPTGEKLAQGDTFGKWWIKNIEIQNSAARVYFGGDTEFITERSGSAGAWLIAAQITVALTEDERIKKVFFELKEGSHLGQGPYARNDFKDLLQPSEYYGSSTYGPCQANNDCLISGCNLEICQSKAEETLVSICILPDKPLPPQLGYKCQCVAQKCQWAK